MVKLIQFFLVLSLSHFVGDLLMAQASSAESGSQSGRRIPAQRAVVAVDGATVYQAPSFDAPVVDYLPRGQGVIASRETVEGAGGLGLFYRVRLPDRRVGFIADVDLVPEFQEGAQSGRTAGRPGRERTNPDFREAKAEAKNPDRQPYYFTRYLGALVGQMNYSEKIADRKLSDTVTLLGFKMTGPGVLFDGPPLDLNVKFHWAAPKYYEKFSGAPATGFFLYGDGLLLFPFLDLRSSLIYYGLGPMWTYSRFRVRVREGAFERYIDSEEFRIGLTGLAAYGLRFDKYTVRAELKYHFEKTQYFSYGLAVQMEY